MISKCATHVYRKAHVGVRYILEHLFLEQLAVRTFLLDILSFRRITFRNKNIIILYIITFILTKMTFITEKSYNKLF